MNEVVIIQKALNCSKNQTLKNWPMLALDNSEKAILEGSFTEIDASIEVKKFQFENMARKMIEDIQESLRKLKKKLFV